MEGFKSMMPPQTEDFISSMILYIFFSAGRFEFWIPSPDVVNNYSITIIMFNLKNIIYNLFSYFRRNWLYYILQTDQMYLNGPPIYIFDS